MANTNGGPRERARARRVTPALRRQKPWSAERRRTAAQLLQQVADTCVAEGKAPLEEGLAYACFQLTLEEPSEIIRKLSELAGRFRRASSRALLWSVEYEARIALSTKSADALDILKDHINALPDVVSSIEHVLKDESRGGNVAASEAMQQALFAYAHPNRVRMRQVLSEVLGRTLLDVAAASETPGARLDSPTPMFDLAAGLLSEALRIEADPHVAAVAVRGRGRPRSIRLELICQRASAAGVTIRQLATFAVDHPEMAQWLGVDAMLIDAKAPRESESISAALRQKRMEGARALVIARLCQRFKHPWPRP